uniref:omega-6 fatty acid desaturase, endoplasmic reticulum-like n=1 Tax=Erigeron canadensis TaxID=72917 RepID=UPI001CB90F18|nr:omega-6 fatty acid desaturase, endoplasmic reticulum-like [Erigeron canadensis]
MNGGNTTNDDVCKRVPIENPPFEYSDLKKAIPPHCFKRSLIRSSYYLLCDLIMVYGLYYIASNYIPLLPKPPLLAYMAWPIYWFCQGTLFMGLWTTGHDLGHNSFSEYPWLDDTIGFIIHSSFLTPYFSFKYSHRRHHAHSGSMEYDEVWIPKKKSDKLYSEILNNPLGNLFIMLTGELIGFPLYFVMNVHGRDYDKFASHFNPNSPMFNDGERSLIWLSIGGVFVTAYALYQVALTAGVKWLFCIYGGPYLVFNIHFMMITFLNHTHPSMPHYDSKAWNWKRSALATVDRDYYGILNGVFKHLTNAHTIHHFFSTIPQYHMVEATNAIKPILGEYYKYDDTPYLKAFWRDTKECIYAKPDEGQEDSGIYWFCK